MKATLSAYLASVRAGEEILVTDRGTPIARIVPVGSAELPDRLSTLARDGIVRLPIEKGAIPRPRLRDPQGRLLSALLEERREGR